MKSEEELERMLENRINQFNYEDNTPTQYDVLYGQILLLNWILDKE